MWETSPAVTFNGYNPTAYPSRTVSINSGNITYWISDDVQADDRRMYTFYVHATVSNKELAESLVIPIKVVAGDGRYENIDYVCFNPIKTDKVLEVAINSPSVFKKESKTATTYDPEIIACTTNPYKIDTYEYAKNIFFTFRIDDAATPIEFKASSLPSSDPSGNSSTYSRNIYFDKNGSIVSSRSFAQFTIVKNDDENGTWSVFMDFDLNNNDLVIEDKVSIGVGHDNTRFEEEPIYVVYPGKSAYEIAVANGFVGTEQE